MSSLEQLRGKQILFLNWRDLRNPAAGGAEAYTEQIAQRFAEAGAAVTLLTSSYQDAPPYDWENGYLVIREGGRFGVYRAAARYLRRHGHCYDAIVDFQNGIPFFAPLWVPGDIPVACLVHHVHQAQFDMYFRWPANRVGRLLEGRVSRHVYRGRPLIAVSPSTRTEMRRQLRFREPIHIIPNGIDPPWPVQVPRSPAPSISVVTRLVPHKQLHLLVEAVPDLLARWPGLRVDIAGTGQGRDALRERVGELGLERVIRLPGRVSEQTKSELLSRAWLTVAPSLGEGWGLTILEANALGTPAVAHDVPGLRDSVRDQVTGWLVPPEQALAGPLLTALDELTDAGRRRELADQCRSWARRFSWHTSAERLAGVLLSESARKLQGNPSRRRVIHHATVASWSPDDTAALDGMLRKALRVTDLITSGESGVTAVLTGCDEVGAAAALRRVPIPPARLRLATTADVLCGTDAGSPR